MTIDALIMLAGTFVVLLPFLGLPNSWDTMLSFFVGVAIVGLGIVVRRRLPAEPSRSGGGGTFVENQPQDPTSHDPL